MTAPDPALDPGQLADLVACCHAVHACGWMPATAGNLSVRVADGLLVTASGVDKGTLRAIDTVRVGLDGVSHNSPVRPSAETSIHAAIYRGTEASAVVHAHPPHATAVASLVGAGDATRVLRIAGYELSKAFGRGEAALDVPVFANHADVIAIAVQVEAWLAASADPLPALLIERHGITTWGADLAEARLRLECIEALCQVLLLTGDVGSAHPHESGAPLR